MPVLLINARLSDRTFKRFLYLKPLTNWLLKKVDAILCSTKQDFDRFTLLNASPLKALVISRSMFLLPKALYRLMNAQTLKLLNWALITQTEHPFILIGASTWEQEEAMLLRVQEQLIASGAACLLILVPRHAEREQAFSSS